MTDRPTMSRAEMERGFAEARMLIQEEWADNQEIVDLDALIKEGKGVVEADWQWLPGFQCQRRKVRGVVTSKEDTIHG